MGDIYRRVVTEFRATGGQQILAQLGQIRGGIQSTRNQLSDMGTQTGLVERQMRALGTTIRYAFAGSAVFGVVNMVRNLSQLQTQLGQIAAIGSKMQGGREVPLTHGDVMRVGAEARHAAVEALTPVSDFNDALINLYSTLQNPPAHNDAVRMVQETALAAKTMQLDVVEAQQAFFQMNFAFKQPQTLEALRRQQREFFTLIKEAPGGVAAGPQIIQQLGPLARIAAGGHGTQEQMLAVTLNALRGGGTPATNLRGLTFLLQTLSTPDSQSKEATAQLHALGITSGAVAQEGVLPQLMKVLRAIRGGGVGGNTQRLRNLDEETLSNLEGDPGTAMTDLGITGQGSQIAARAFHRIHAFRAAIGLAVQGPDQIMSDLRLLNDAGKGITDDAHNLARAVADFKRESPLPQAAQAIQSMQLDIASALAPALSYPARGIVGLEGVVSKHQNAAAATLLGGSALGIALARRGGGGAGLLGRFGRGAVGTSIAAQGLANIGGEIGTNPANPLFVYVVGQGLNPFAPGGRGTATAGGAARTAEKEAMKTAERRGLGAAAKGALGMRFLGVPTVPTLAAALVLGGVGGDAGPGMNSSEKERAKIAQQNPRWTRLFNKWQRTNNFDKLSPVEQQALKITGGIGSPDATPRNLRRAERLLEHVATLPQGGAQGGRERRLGGKAHVTVDVNLKDPKTGDTVATQRAHVPMVLFEVFGREFTLPAPQTRGKNTTQRGGR